MSRPKPYQRSTSDTYKRANPDAPGKWSHDMHENKSSLLSRMSNGSNGKAGSSKGSLLDRISGGQGKELLPSSSSAPKLHGFGGTPQNPNNVNAGVELLPGAKPRQSEPASLNKGRLLQSGLDAALGMNAPRRQVIRPMVPERGTVNILGAGRGVVLVRVENLAVGTTAEDVVSAFAPAPIESARLTSSSPSTTVTIELEMSSRQAAEDVIQRYDGAVADGNALKVAIVKQNLTERMNGGGVGPVRNARRDERAVGQELLASKGSSKMYSDSILATNSGASIITLAQQEEAGRRDRAQTWSKTTPSLMDRMNGGGRRGRGQIGGGSYADMMVD